MDWLIRLFSENFILVILLGGWVLSIFGNVLTKAAKKASEQQRRRAQGVGEQRPLLPGQRQPTPGQRPLLPGQRPTQREQPGSTRTQVRQPAAATPARPPRPAVPTAEDIATEIRRVMGMEEPPQRALAPEPPPPPPTPEEPGFTTEAGFEHFGENVGGLHSGVKSHVGEGVHSRHTPGSGKVGTRELGSLGGRVHRAPKTKVVKRVKRFDLSDPAAVLVTLEILGKPRALRDFEEF